jgi:hypothetical protein
VAARDVEDPAAGPDVVVGVAGPDVDVIVADGDAGVDGVGDTGPVPDGVPVEAGSVDGDGVRAGARRMLACGAVVARGTTMSTGAGGGRTST